MNTTRIVEWIVIACLVASAAVYVSSLVVQRNLARADAAAQKAVAETEKRRAAGFEASLSSCLSAAKEQNTQVLALKAERDRLQAQHEVNKTTAEKEAQPHFERAGALGRLRAPVGEDPCIWAHDLVDKTLSEERGK